MSILGAGERWVVVLDSTEKGINPIVELKEKHQLTLTDIADKVGVSFGLIWQLTRGFPKKLSKRVLDGIIKSFGGTAEDWQARYVKWREASEAVSERSWNRYSDATATADLLLTYYAQTGKISDIFVRNVVSGIVTCKYPTIVQQFWAKLASEPEVLAKVVDMVELQMTDRQREKLGLPPRDGSKKG